MTTPLPNETAPSRSTFTRGKTVMVMLLGGVLGMIGGTQTWIEARGFDAAHIDTVHLSGQEASPVITAMALVLIAAGAALSIAGRLGRLIIGSISVLSAVMLIVATGNILMDPTAAVASTIAEISGTTASSATVDTVTVTLLPWLTIIGAVVALFGGLLVLIYGQRWALGKTKKYAVSTETDETTTGRLDEIDTWDELSRGEDPT